MHVPAGAAIRVLALADHLGHPDGRIHGGTTYFINCYPALQRAGVELTACFLGEEHPAGQRLRDAGVHPIFLNRAKWDPRAYGDVKRLMARCKPQIAHLASYKSNLIGRLLAPRFACRTIVHVHDQFAPRGIIGLLQRRVAARTDLGIGVSEAVRQMVVKAYAIPEHRTTTLFNGLDTSRYTVANHEARSALRGEFRIASTTTLVALIGRFDPVKGHDDALEAVRQLRAEGRDVALIMIGDGPTRSSIEKRVDSLGLEDATYFTGQRDDIPELLAAVDVVLIPSHSEGMSFVAVEAMAAGRCLVAYATGGLPDIIHHEKSGLLAPTGNVGALAEALARVLDDEDLRNRLAREGRRQVDRYSIDVHVARLLNIYQSVLNGDPIMAAMTEANSRG